MTLEEFQKTTIRHTVLQLAYAALKEARFAAGSNAQRRKLTALANQVTVLQGDAYKEMAQYRSQERTTT